MFRNARVLILVVAALAVVPSTASAWAPAASAPIHPGVQTFTAGAQCTANFIFTDGGNIYIGQAAHCSGTGGRPTPTAARRLAADRHAGRGRRAPASPGPSSTTRGSRCRRTASRRQHLPVQRPRAGQARPGRRRQGQPVGARLRRPDRRRRRLGRRGDDVYSYGNSSLRGGVTQLSPKQGVVRRRRGQRLEPHRLHGHAGHPGRLGQRVHGRDRPGARRAEHGRARAAGGLERGRRPQPRAGLRACAQPARRGLSSTARSRSRQTSSARSWARGSHSGYGNSAISAHPPTAHAGGGASRPCGCGKRFEAGRSGFVPGGRFSLGISR